jgi:ABC-type microcin C transport system permease subunit YejE
MPTGGSPRARYQLRQAARLGYKLGRQQSIDPPAPVKVRLPSITGFEPRAHKVVSRFRFAQRMAIAVGLWLAITLVGLAIGVAGYMGTEGMSLTDAYVNAAMILSGMGPVGELKTTLGKVFAGSYAIFSGLIIVIASGFVLAPLFHRVLHKFHVEAGKKD